MASIRKTSPNSCLEDPTGFVPCTPAGCMELLETAGIATAGAEAVVIGRSMIVGKPMALLLVSKNCQRHRHHRPFALARTCPPSAAAPTSSSPPSAARKWCKADWVKPGAVVIDVGINRVDDPSKKSGYRLTGDVAYDEVAPQCSAITPVPGGVGPMTIAMLMKNTLQAARQISQCGK